MRFRKQIEELGQYKFVKDSAFTFVSYVILASSGIIANILIGNAYNASGLGIFNQTLALYMILSLLAVFGLNSSVIKHIAQFNQNTEKQKEIFTSASVLAAGLSITLTLVLGLLAYIFPSLYFNAEVTKSTAIIILSLPFLTQNKIFMALLNALRYMKAFAIIQSMRWILIISFILISIFLDKSVYFLSYSFLISEFLLLTFFMIFYSKYFSLKYRRSEWYKTHFIFGGKSVLLGFLSETNNNVDIFLIGFFLSNYYVGIYSFASVIAKGFLSIASVIQFNINPIVSDLWEKMDLASLRKYTKKISKVMLLLVIPILTIAALIYPLFIYLFMEDGSYVQSIPVFYILLAGVILPAIYNFAGAYLTMANFINTSLKILILIVIYNVLSCSLFIWLFGFWGAAISTSTTYVLFVLLVQYNIRKKMGITLISLKPK
jgi:O-antigen/teichoic acid export membrane protein